MTLVGSHRVGCTCPGSEEQSLDPGSRRWIGEAVSDPTQTEGTGYRQEILLKRCHELYQYDHYDEVTFVLQ